MLLPVSIQSLSRSGVLCLTTYWCYICLDLQTDRQGGEERKNHTSKSNARERLRAKVSWLKIVQRLKKKSLKRKKKNLSFFARLACLVSALYYFLIFLLSFVPSSDYLIIGIFSLWYPCAHPGVKRCSCLLRGRALQRNRHCEELTQLNYLTWIYADLSRGVEAPLVVRKHWS